MSGRFKVNIGGEKIKVSTGFWRCSEIPRKRKQCEACCHLISSEVVHTYGNNYIKTWRREDSIGVIVVRVTEVTICASITHQPNNERSTNTAHCFLDRWHMGLMYKKALHTWLVPILVVTGLYLVVNNIFRWVQTTGRIHDVWLKKKRKKKLQEKKRKRSSNSICEYTLYYLITYNNALKRFLV